MNYPQPLLWWLFVASVVCIAAAIGIAVLAVRTWVMVKALERCFLSFSSIAAAHIDDDGIHNRPPQ